MKVKPKPRRRRLPARFKKIGELLPNYGKFKKELDKTYELCKKIPSDRSLQISSNGPDIPLPQNIDDAKLNVLCTNPKEMKYAWDVLMKYQEEELDEKKPEGGIKKEESPLCKEMQDGLLGLHDLIIDGSESVSKMLEQIKITSVLWILLKGISLATLMKLISNVHY